MKNSNSSFLNCFSLGTCVLLLLLCHANAEDRKEPRKNPNLSPFESWRSAYFCLQNVTGAESCKGNHTLTLKGWLNVLDAEIKHYCAPGGCYEHTLKVFQCIQDVKRNFKFESNAPLSFVKNEAVQGCSKLQAFSTKYTDPNSATSLFGRFYLPLVSTLTTLAFIATFTV